MGRSAIKYIFLSICIANITGAQGKKSPTDASTTTKNTSQFAQALSLLNEKAQYFEAHTAFSQLFREDPSCTECLYHSSMSMLLLGNTNYYPGERTAYDLALEGCEQLLEKDSKNPSYILLAAYIHAKTGLFDRKKHAGLFSGLWSLKKSINLLDEVIGTEDLDDLEAHQYDPIIARGDTWIQALIGRAEAYRDSPSFWGGDKAAALRILERIHHNHNTHARALYVLARTYYKTFQAQRARTEFKKLEGLYQKGKIKKTGINHFIHMQLPYALGRVHWDLGEREEACRLFQEHIQRHTRSPWGHEWVSRCYEQSGDYKSAKKMLKLALKYEPFNEEYKEKLESLQDIS